MTNPTVSEIASPAARAQTQTTLSVLIPFYRDDPRPLLFALAEQAGPDMELVCFDDGAPDPALNRAVADAVSGSSASVRLITSSANLGRSAARNRLGSSARGAWLLFLDADMRIDTGFLARWRAALNDCAYDAVFGGYEPIKAEHPAHAVHAALAQVSDVHSAAEREAIGAAAVCSSNLAVTARLFAQVPFDEAYTGWGWEDVDWALRADAAGTMGHVDAPAGHAGLQDVETLLRKFASAGPNFARLLDRHPSYEARPGARLARRLQRVGLGAPARLVGATLAKTHPLPARLRAFGLKLFRAGAAAEALS